MSKYAVPTERERFAPFTYASTLVSWPAPSIVSNRAGGRQCLRGLPGVLIGFLRKNRRPGGSPECAWTIPLLLSPSTEKPAHPAIGHAEIGECQYKAV